MIFAQIRNNLVKKTRHSWNIQETNMSENERHPSRTHCLDRGHRKI